MPSRRPTIRLEYASPGAVKGPRQIFPLGRLCFALTLVVLGITAVLAVGVQVGRIRSSSNNAILRHLEWCAVGLLGVGFVSAAFRSQREFAIVAIFIALIEVFLLPTFMTA